MTENEKNNRLKQEKTEKRHRTIPKVIAELKAEDPGMPVSAGYLRRMAKQGALPYHLIGHRIIVTIEDVKQLYGGQTLSKATNVKNNQDEEDSEA